MMPVSSTAVSSMAARMYCRHEGICPRRRDHGITRCKPGELHCDMRTTLDLIERHRLWFVDHKKNYDEITPGESV